MNTSKYEFYSKKQAQTKIDALGFSTDEDGNKYPTHSHAIVHLGNIVLEQAVINEDGEVIKKAVLSKKWHLDVMWFGLEDHPYGWKSKSIDIEGEGVHAFYGLSFDLLKF